MGKLRPFLEENKGECQRPIHTKSEGAKDGCVEGDVTRYRYVVEYRDSFTQHPRSHFTHASVLVFKNSSVLLTAQNSDIEDTMICFTLH
ncbi:hypothetical protein NPIL_314631 [Nephila pilipes]|uniref:Uncharacterized protein n=1 Tax=Nephila pilipes TaxID=299642 RepID=A0A8X6PFQ4_NEPPI|nr:hypothetical protein NPIL_314631 [Nephila pilipes]